MPRWILNKSNRGCKPVWNRFFFEDYLYVFLSLWSQSENWNQCYTEWCNHIGALKGLMSSFILCIFPETYKWWSISSVKQSDRNSSKTDIFHKPATFKPHVYTSSERIITFARHEYERVGVFRIRMRSLVQKL